MDKEAVRKHLDSYFAAFNKLDAKAVASLFAEDAIWRDLAMAREMRGRDEIAAFVAEIVALSPDFSLTCRRIVIDGNQAAVLHDMAGHQTAEFMGYPATGGPYEVRVSSHFEFSDGMISNLTDNWNLHTLLSDLGLITLDQK